MSITEKPSDPADRAADGAFGGVHSHRAGYGDDKLARLVDYLRQRPSATLASGEGALLLGEIDRLRDDLHTQDGWVQWAKGEINALRRANKDSLDHYADARAEIDRLRDQLHLADQSARSSSAEAARLGRILVALREPSEDVSAAMWRKWGACDPQNHFAATLHALARAAVAAAEQEVGRE